MKQVYSILLAVVIIGSAQAQPILSNGFGALAAIDGNNYKKTVNIGTGNYAFVSASADGQYFYAGGTNTIADKIYYVQVANNTITDSISMPSNSGDMSSSNQVNTLFSLRGSSLYRINTASKAIDSIIIGNPNRIEERPGAKEAWVAADSMIYIVDYTSALAFTTIRLSSNKFDNSDVRFTKGGTIAYKAATSVKKIYKIDCVTKSVIDSIDTSPVGHFAIEVSSDSSKIYATNNKAVYVYSVASKMLTDSFVADKLVMNLYTHPTRQELWAVHHFDDSVTVFDESSKAIIASFDIGNDPFHLAFATGTVGVASLHLDYEMEVYPNPASSCLNIVTPGNIQNHILVCDIFGRRVLQSNSTSSKTSIDISHLTVGNYYVVVSVDNRQTQVMPFVKN